MESMSGYGALEFVTGGVTLAALIVLATVGAIRAGISKDVDVLKTIDGSNEQIAARERVALTTLEKLHIDTKGMSSADKKEIALAQLLERRKRLTVILLFSLALGVVGAVVGVIALTSSSSDRDDRGGATIRNKTDTSHDTTIQVTGDDGVNIKGDHNTVVKP